MFTTNLRKFTLFVIGFSLIGFAGCSGQPVGEGGNSSGRTGSGALQFQGSGSTFAKPIMDKWTSEFGKVGQGIRIDYTSTGSGAGIKAIQGRTADFGASDAAMTKEEMAASPGEIVHIPVILGAVVITYNLPELKEPLRLSPEVISDIYLGKIKRWDDERLRKDNPTAALPATDITPVFRADGSGTSDVLTDFLSKTVPEWKEKIGRTKNPQLPEGVGIGGKGNEGVMGQVKNTPNTIGYVELTYAKANGLPSASIKNASGEFVAPSVENVSIAASEIAGSMPEDLRTEFTNAKGAGAYPISGAVYVLVYKDQQDPAKGKALADFLWWATHEGQAFAADLHYAALPPAMVEKASAKINALSSGGKPLRQ